MIDALLHNIKGDYMIWIIGTGTIALEYAKILNQLAWAKSPRCSATARCLSTSHSSTSRRPTPKGMAIFRDGQPTVALT